MPPFKPDRRIVLQGLALSAGLAAAPARARATPGPAAFLAVGDWGRNGERQQAAVARAMAEAAAEVGSRFVVSVGDNFYPAGVQSADDPQWRTSFEDVYAAAALQTPWFSALGNHDYRGRPEAQIEYGRRSARWRMPGRSYVARSAETSVPGLDLFVIDTTPLVQDYGEEAMRLARGRLHVPRPEAQYDWLEAALAASDAPWKIVVGHHPVFSGGRHGGSPVLAERLQPMLSEHGVQAYLCGHDHTLQHIQQGGVAHICTGAGASAGEVAETAGGRFRYSRPGFALFRLKEDALSLEFRDSLGRTLYRAIVSRDGRA